MSMQYYARADILLTRVTWKLFVRNALTTSGKYHIHRSAHAQHCVVYKVLFIYKSYMDPACKGLVKNAIMHQNEAGPELNSAAPPALLAMERYGEMYWFL